MGREVIRVAHIDQCGAVTQPVADQEDWGAQNDARALADAAEVRADPGRFARALEAAERMAKGEAERWSRILAGDSQAKT